MKALGTCKANGEPVEMGFEKGYTWKFPANPEAEAELNKRFSKFFYPEDAGYPNWSFGLSWLHKNFNVTDVVNPPRTPLTDEDDKRGIIS
jgi:hypothetical protein